MRLEVGCVNGFRRRPRSRLAHEAPDGALEQASVLVWSRRLNPDAVSAPSVNCSKSHAARPSSGFEVFPAVLVEMFATSEQCRSVRVDVLRRLDAEGVEAVEGVRTAGAVVNLNAPPLPKCRVPCVTATMSFTWMGAALAEAGDEPEEREDQNEFALVWSPPRPATSLGCRSST